MAAYETPGGTILFYAHRELEYLCLDRATMHFKEQLAVRHGELVYDGMCLSPLKEAMDAFVDTTQQTVTGTVRMKLSKGNIMSAGAKSPYSLFHEGFVTFGRDEVYNQKMLEGFINLFGLPLKIRALMQKEYENNETLGWPIYEGHRQRRGGVLPPPFLLTAVCTGKILPAVLPMPGC